MSFCPLSPRIMRSLTCHVQLHSVNIINNITVHKFTKPNSLNISSSLINMNVKTTDGKISTLPNTSYNTARRSIFTRHHRGVYSRSWHQTVEDTASHSVQINSLQLRTSLLHIDSMPSRLSTPNISSPSNNNDPFVSNSHLYHLRGTTPSATCPHSSYTYHYMHYNTP